MRHSIHGTEKDAGDLSEAAALNLRRHFAGSFNDL
jgi:hypothetical protein